MARKGTRETPPWQSKIVGYDTVLTDSILANPRNWRIHPQAQQDALTGALHGVGIVQNLVINKRTSALWPPEDRYVETLCDGHLRVTLALREGQPTLPVTYVDLTPDEENLVLATFDPIAALAGVDAPQLSDLLHETTTSDATLMAFLSALAEEHGIVPPDAQGPVVEVEPEIDRAEVLRAQYGVTVGQLWGCGEHRILCGESRDPNTIARLMATVVPAMVVADPPYGVSIVATNGYVGGGEANDIPFGGRKGHQRDTRRGTIGAAKPFGSKQGRGTVGPHDAKIDVGKYAPVIGDDSTETAITAATMFLTAYPKAVHVWWGGNYYANALPASSCWLVWDKETTGNFADCELAWTNQPKAARLFHHRWNGMLRDSERERRWHPTQKPAALFAWVYDTYGHAGDVVLDPFLGCGPTLIAAAQTNRVLYGIELSPEYVAVALERWHKLSGELPQRIA